MKPAEAQEWLLEASRYFAKRDTGGEDRAFWANRINSDNCRFIAQLIGTLDAEIENLRFYRGTLTTWRGKCGHLWDRAVDDTDQCPRCKAEARVRELEGLGPR